MDQSKRTLQLPRCLKLLVRADRARIEYSKKFIIITYPRNVPQHLHIPFVQTRLKDF